MKLKTILIEPFLVMEVGVCWTVALAAGALFLSGVALWERAATAVAPRGPAGPAGTGMSPVFA